MRRIIIAAAVCAALLLAAAGPASAVPAPTAPTSTAPTSTAPTSKAPSERVTPGPAAGLRTPERCTPPSRQDTIDRYTGAARMQLSDLHRLATGRGQVIAVIDTGISPHPLLGDRLRGGGDYLAGGDGLDDCDGHGTAVAGLLAAAPDPGPDGRGDTPLGIAPGARLLAIRQSSPSFEVPGPSGPRPAGDINTLAAAIRLAVAEGARVVNISEAVCVPPGSAAVVGAPVQAALRRAAEADVVVVAAAGNVGSGSCTADDTGQVSLPGWYDDGLLTVGAIGADDSAAPFTVPGPWVDVAAPGTGLRSLAVGGGTTSAGVDGTSFATPWVAGLAALIRERYPELTAAQVGDRIIATARRPAGGGPHDALGHGIIDPVAALTAVPAVLDSRSAPAVPAAGSARLAGTTAAPGPAGRTWPFDIAAVLALLAAAALVASVLRRTPARFPRRH